MRKKTGIAPIAVLVSLIFLSSVFAQTAAAQDDIPFADHIGHVWENGIEFVYNRGIVEGYPDGTYKPYQTLKRAELLKVIVASSYPESSYNSYETDTCFDDVDGTQWYNKYVCFGKAEGIIQGYDDGTFRPEQEVNFVEALKIMFIGMDVDLTSNVSEPWYQMYYDTADSKYLVPEELEGEYAHNFSRAQAAEVIKRILSLDAHVVQPPVYETDGGYEPGTVYMGYLQEGNVLDLYLIADSNINEYMPDEPLPFTLSGNIVNSWSNDRYGEFNDADMTVLLKEIPLRTNEVRHIATLYLESNNPVTIVIE